MGALLGQHHAREISLEHAFECDVILNQNDEYVLNDDWFRVRLQQYRTVHKAPVLDLVGWFTTAPVTGPETQHVPIHKQILDEFNETALLLSFHPSSVLEGAAIGGKLPITIYESVYENIKSEGQNGDEGDGTMEIESQETLQNSQLDIRFKEVPYSVETGEAEMIGIDFVARGGGNATAVNSSTKNSISQDLSTSFNDIDSRPRGQQNDVKVGDEASVLSPEDEEREW